MQRKRKIERRNYRRYKAIEGAYAAICPSVNKLGPITDISMGGLCFNYIDTNNGYQDSPTPIEQSFLLCGLNHHIGDIAFRIISDYEMANTSTFSLMKIRKNHIQFRDLNLKQFFDLDIFLKNNVSGQVEEFSMQYN